MLHMHLLARLLGDYHEMKVREQAQRDTAYALACQLVHCDRSVEPAERQFLVGLAEALGLDPLRRDQVLEVCELLHRDCLATPG